MLLDRFRTLWTLEASVEVGELPLTDGIVLLLGDAVGAGSAAATTFAKEKVLAGAATGAGSATAAFLLEIPLASAGSGSGSATAGFTTEQLFAAAGAGVGSAVAELVAEQLFAAAGAGAGSAAAELLVEALFAGVGVGAGSTEGDLADLAAVKLAGTATAAGSATARLGLILGLGDVPLFTAAVVEINVIHCSVEAIGAIGAQVLPLDEVQLEVEVIGSIYATASATMVQSSVYRIL